MSSARAVDELERLADIAHQRGRTKIEAVCRLALARIAELEAERALHTANRSSGGQARAEGLTPERRRAIASDAARQRWQRRADDRRAS